MNKHKYKAQVEIVRQFPIGRPKPKTMKPALKEIKCKTGNCKIK